MQQDYTISSGINPMLKGGVLMMYYDAFSSKSGIGSYIRGDDMPSQDDINKLISNPQLLEE